MKPGVYENTKRVGVEGTTAVLSDDEFKEYLYEMMAQFVRSKGYLAGQPTKQGACRLSKPKARRLFEYMTELIFTRVVETGYFRFPSGYGSLTLTRLKEDAAPRPLPDGTMIQPKPRRFKVRYSTGVTVLEMLGVNPNKYKRKTAHKSVFDEPMANSEETSAAPV